MRLVTHDNTQSWIKSDLVCYNSLISTQLPVKCTFSTVYSLQRYYTEDKEIWHIILTNNPCSMYDILSKETTRGKSVSIFGNFGCWGRGIVFIEDFVTCCQHDHVRHRRRTSCKTDSQENWSLAVIILSIHVRYYCNDSFHYLIKFLELNLRCLSARMHFADFFAGSIGGNVNVNVNVKCELAKLEAN